MRNAHNGEQILFRCIYLATLGSGSCMKALAGAVQPKSPPCGTKQQYCLCLGQTDRCLLGTNATRYVLCTRNGSGQAAKSYDIDLRMSPLQVGFHSPRKIWLQWQVVLQSCFFIWMNPRTASQACKAACLELSRMLEVFANPICRIVVQI